MFAPGRGRAQATALHPFCTAPRCAGIGLAFALAAAPFQPATAAGVFSLPWKDVRDTGMGFSSGITETESPSAAFFNPAGLAWQRSPRRALGGFLVYPESRFQGQAHRSSVSQPGDPDHRIAGGSGGNPGQPSPLPDAYYSRPGGRAWTWAVGSSADGFNFRYDRDWVGRYHGIDTRLLLPNLHVAVGWAVGQGMGLGLGLNVQGLDARFTQDVDLGATIEREAKARCAQRADPLICAPIVPQQLGGRYDFHNDLRAQELTPGWTAGLLLRLGEKAELGLAYRSAIRHQLNGWAYRRRSGSGHDGQPGWDGDELRNDPDLGRLRLFLDGRSAITGEPGFEEQVVQPSLRNSSDAPFHARLVFPETLSLGLRRRFGDRWIGSAATEWTRWGRLDQFTAAFADSDVVTVELGLKDILRIGLGAEYRWRPGLRLRAGLAAEGGPDNPRMRSARAPDGERRYLNLGLGWTLNEDRQLDLVASLLDFSGGPVRDVAVGSGNVLEGRIEDFWAVALGARLSW